MPVTIRDVARKAKVGVGTVSRVLNNSPDVSQATRERVQAAIHELGYRPSRAARNLALGRTNTVGVVTPFFTRPSFVNRLRGIQAEITRTEYDLVLFSVDTPEKSHECFNNGATVDGMIVIALGVSEYNLESLAQWAVPIVLLDTYYPGQPHIIVDDVSGGQIATDHLIALGHRRIAYVSDVFDDPYGFVSSRMRYKGYRQALEAAQIPFQPAYHRQGEHGRYEACQLALQLLDLPNPPTAIFAASDTQALGVMEAIRSRELHIPEDISVIGYDDIEIAEYLNLTTIRQPMYRSGQIAVTLLLDLMAGKTPEETAVTLSVEIVQRGTTGPPP
jgi:DNA-binding LacI/PurR family transcriptional regulator